MVYVHVPSPERNNRPFKYEVKAKIYGMRVTIQVAITRELRAN
jgi:hypothetical protein